MPEPRPGCGRRAALWTRPHARAAAEVAPAASAGAAQLAAFDPPPDVDGAEGAGVDEVVDEDELSFEADEPSLDEDEEAASEALPLLRLSVR
jgi:hypothetical protein